MKNAIANGLMNNQTASVTALMYVLYCQFQAEYELWDIYISLCEPFEYSVTDALQIFLHDDE